jgi:regulator of nucleoside diphosphate kinase
MTTMHTEQKRPAINLPPIVITDHDHEKLSRFVERQSLDLPYVTEFLEQELVRARVVPSREIPRDVVTMNSRLVFRTEVTGLSRAVTLVYPAEADLMTGRLSILTPVGVALLGLRPGQAMPWEDRTGRIKTLTIQQVQFQPEASGRFDL